MLKIERLNKNPQDSRLEYVCHITVLAKIEILLKTGLPDRWDEALISPIISKKQLEIEHSKVRGNCHHVGKADDNPDRCCTPYECDRCRAFDPYDYSIGPMLGERGDILLYPSEKNRDEFDRMFEALTDALAIIAFIPRGIPDFWGYSYEAKFDV